MEGFDLSTVSGIYMGSSEISALYLGSSLIWPTNFQEEYLTITSIGKTLDNNSQNIIKFYTTDISCVRQIQVSYNKVNWTTYTSSISGTEIGSLLRGRKLYVRGINSCYSEGEYYYNYFSSSKEIFVSGNIMSLIDYENFREMTSLSEPYALAFLFKNSIVIDASNLILPATTLSAFCYKGLFEESFLTKSPKELPATTLANSCYQNMFYDCMSLRTAPTLPATTLADYCYECMFWNCYELEKAPTLPAETMTIGCYRGMFGVCKSIVYAPQLPATTLAEGCYDSMFESCESLKLLSGYKLPATTLATECYAWMFKGCTSLTTAPELPAATLANKCYKWMFYGCSRLNKITMLATDNQLYSKDAIGDWVYGVAVTGTFTKLLEQTSIRENDDSGIPRGWSIKNVYSISIVNSTGGTINVNKYYGRQGDRVTITPDPDYGYELDTVTVTDLQGNIITVTNNTFVMPASSVTITSTWINHSELYLTIESLSYNNDIYWNYFNPQSNTKQIYYSRDKVNWSIANAGGMKFITLNTGGKVYIKATNSTYGDFAYHFNSTGDFKVYGNIMSLRYGDNFVGETTLTTSYQFQTLFYGCTHLIDASGLILPATSLAVHCYEEMFKGCTNLVSAPKILPATTLRDYCYYSMFELCTSLVNPPELPATTLAENCYNSMFSGCTSLVIAPDLPAKIVPSSAYEYMFYHCSSLNEIKMLATDIEYGGTYVWVGGVAETGTFTKAEAMTSLSIGVHGIPTGWIVEDILGNRSISITQTSHGTVTAPEHADAGDIITLTVTPDPGCLLDTLTVLDANSNPITVTNNKFTMPDSDVTIYAVFYINYNINYLTIESETDNNIIRWQFNNPSYIQDIQYSTDIINWSTASAGNQLAVLNTGDKLYLKGALTGFNSPNYYNYIITSNNFKVYGNIMSLIYGDNFTNQTALTQNYQLMRIFQNSKVTDASNLELPATTLTNNCYAYMFYGCTSLNAAPALPATTLTNYCYQGMFYGCTSLTTAPDLLAETLINYCYNQMFYGCTSLNYIKCLATNIAASGCLTNWVNSVAASGTFVKYASVTFNTGNHGIPTGWVVDNIYFERNITISQMTNGTVTSNKQTAHFGEIITLTVTPDRFYELDTLTVIDANSNPITVTNNQFTMPDADVTISATFSIDYDNSYLTIESQAANNTISWKCNDASYTQNIQYSTNLTNWTTVTSTTSGATLTTLRNGGKLYLKGALTGHNSASYYDYIASSGNFKVYGNIMSLIYGDNFTNQTALTQYAQLVHLFSDSKVTDASNLIMPATTLTRSCYWYMFKGCTLLTTSPTILPATTLTDSCYRNMFEDCSSLTTAPTLPATTLADNCYDSMFEDCSSLTTAPTLPATTLTDWCYDSMFSGCTSLTTAPTLPATTLADYCYTNMFLNCSSLTTAPALPVTTLTDWCYYQMFKGCSSLTTAPTLPATTLTVRCYESMFSGCSSLTTAPTLPATTLTVRCYESMFSGCSSLTTAPTLPATTLTNECYSYMFYGCYSLTTAPALPATTLVTKCYYRMFYDCVSLNYITMLATNISATDCLTDWVWNVDNSGTFVKDPSMTTLPDGCDGIPTGWTVISQYYQQYLTIESQADNNTIMYKTNDASHAQYIKCSTDLTHWKSVTASSSGATISTLNTGDKIYLKGSIRGFTTYSYYNYIASTGNFKVYGNIMSLTNEDNFGSASSFTADYQLMRLFSESKVTDASNLILPLTTLRKDCYRSLFQNCTSLTKAPELPATTLAMECYREMFKGCSSLTKAPELPATILYEGCYRAMFSGCSLITTAPELPATTLATYCYYYMFENCTPLNYIKCLATNISFTNATAYWVKNVSSSGTFVKDSSMTSWATGQHGIPSGWTIQNA